MPLADFLAEFRGTGAGMFGHALGGKSRAEKSYDTFINNELPALADQITRAQTKEDVARVGQALIGAGLKARMPIQGLEKVMGMLVGPALQNLRQADIDSIRRDYAAQPSQPRPEGVEGPLTEGGAFVPAREARPYDEDAMIRLNQATGGNAATLDNMLRAPSQNAQARASAAHTDEQVKAAQARQRALDSLSNEPDEAGVSLRGLAQFPSLAQKIPVREKPEDPLLDVRRRDFESRIKRNEAEGAAATTRATTGREREARLTDQDIVTSTDQTLRPGDSEIINADLAAQVARSPKKDAVTIRKIADKAGYEIEGEPTLVDEGRSLPFASSKWRLGGDITIKKKPRVTTKTKGGGGNNDPLGIRKSKP